MSEKNLQLNLPASAQALPRPRLIFGSRKTVLEVLRQFILYVILIVGSLPFLFPLLFMVSTSLKSKGEVLLVPIRWIPSHFIWGNYYEAMFGYLPLYWFMW